MPATEPCAVRIEDEIKQPVFVNAAHKAFINVVFTAGWLSVRQAAVFKTFGLTLPQYNILRILRGQHPNPATVALLVDRMLDKTSNASRIVDRLEEKHLATRQICPANRRAVDIRITQAGLDQLRRTECETSATPHAHGLDNLNADELNQLNDLLDKIRNRS